MDAPRHRCAYLARSRLTLLGVLFATGAVETHAESVFLCRSVDGPPLFSDLPCRPAHGGEAVHLGIELHNLASGMALSEADRRHLAEIEARPARRAGFAGLPDPEQLARCQALRDEMAALRRTARQGHDGSAGAERRRLREAIHRSCH